MLFILDSDQDSQDSQDSDYSDCSTTLQLLTLGLRTTHVSPIVDRVFPTIREYLTNAYYIKPPDYRIPATRERRRVLLETQDPDDPSTILIVPVDGYLPLACPLSPSSCALQHCNSSSCSSLRSIPAVIRHLAKHHREPIYCPICGTLFDLALSRDAHIHTRSCARRNIEVAPGVSRAQLEELVRGDDANQHEEERWWRIYKVLFPDGATKHSRPPRGAAYLWEGMPLAVTMARDYWDCYGRDTVEAYLADESVAGGAEITAQEASVLCGLVGKELVQRVIAGGLGDDIPKAAGHVGSPGETEWDSVKADEG